MTFRLSALARSMMVAALLIASLAMLAPMGAAQSDRGLIDETSYQSPQFGYSVTWGDPWEARDRDVITNPGGFDTITLRSIDGTVRISGRSDEYDPLTFLQDTIAIQLASGGEVINQDTTGPVPTAELLIGREQMRIDVISLPESGAIVLISLRADERDFDAALASAQESIQIEGNPIFDLAAQAQTPVTTGTVTTETPAATETATAESTQEVLGTGIEGDTYTSPNFGFSISWDPTIWTVPEEAEYSEPDFDFLRLESATGPITVSGWNAYSGDPASCLVGEQTYYSDPEAGISEWQVAVDADGNELTGQSETNAWGVYTNVYTSPDNPDAEPVNYVDYIECVSLGDGESVVIFHSYAMRDVYNDHIGNVLALIETLELPGSVATPPVTPETTATIPDTTPEATATTPAATVEATEAVPPTATGGQPVVVGQTEVTWTGAWQLDEATTISEQLTLSQIDPATGSLLLASYGEFADTTVNTNEEALESFTTAFFESAGASNMTEVGTGTLDDGTLWKHYTFDLQGIPLSLLITVNQSSPNQFVVATLTGNTETFGTSLTQAQQEILLNGQPGFLAGIAPEMLEETAGSPTPATEGTQAPSSTAEVSTPTDSTPVVSTDGNVVTGQTYAYRFAVPAGWQTNESTLGGDIERTVLTNGTSTVIVEARSMSAPTLSDCVSNVGGEHANEPVYDGLALARTASGDPFSGEDDFSAFANFTFTGPDGATWSHFIECRWIVEGESVLVVIQDVPQEAFGSERAARRQIQNSIEIGQ